MMATEPVVDLVTACKALAARGCDTGIGGHVSLRDPERNEFWINCFDRTLGEMTVSDVVKLDHLGNNVLNDRVVSQGGSSMLESMRSGPMSTRSCIPTGSG